MHGLALCAAMSVIIFGSLYQDPMVWARSSPKDVQAFVPGTADLPGLRDPRWHVGAYLKGFAGGFVFAALVTGLGWLLA